MKADIMFLVKHFRKVGLGKFIFHHSLFFYILKKVATSMHMMQDCRIRMKHELDHPLPAYYFFFGRGFIFGKTMILYLSSNWCTLNQYLDKANDPNFAKSFTPK